MLHLNLSRFSNTDLETISHYQSAYLDSLYFGRVNNANELINGREYIPYYFKCRIKPLLFEDMKRNGSMLFNGRKYNDLTLEYDTYLDQLIYSDSSKLIDNKIFKIEMNKDMVEEFRLYFKYDSMVFRHFRTGTGSWFNLEDGFYEVVYDGASKFIIRHRSLPVEQDGMYEYRSVPSKYLQTTSNFSRVRSARSFVKMFGTYSGRVRQYMRTNRIHFPRAGKKEVAAVLKYYDSLATSGK